MLYMPLTLCDSSSSLLCMGESPAPVRSAPPRCRNPPELAVGVLGPATMGLSDDGDFSSEVSDESDGSDGEGAPAVAEGTPPAPGADDAALTREERKAAKEKEREERRVARAKKRREKSQKRNAAKREAAEKAASDELEAARMEAMIAHSKVELEWMELEEEARLVEKELRVAKENLRKVTLYCQRKGQEELRAKAGARGLRRSRTVRTSARDEASEWLELCDVSMAKSRKMSLRVNRDTKVMDTRSIAGVYQRFETNQLHRELHAHYFRTLAKIISNRAELIGTERRQMLIHEITRHNTAATVKRYRELESLQRKQRRADLMRLRRSELGKRIFRKCQRRLHFGLMRRDIAFIKRLRGRRCLLITDQSPHPPGVSHQAQHHIGHLTFLWVDDDAAKPEDAWKVQAYTASVFESESTAAKFVLHELEQAPQCDREHSVEFPGNSLGTPWELLWKLPCRFLGNSLGIPWNSQNFH